MAQLTVQRLSRDGVSPTFTAADISGDAFANSGRQCLIIKNGGAASVTVTINSQKPCDQGFDHDITVDVPAGAERWCGPFEPNRFNDPAGNVVVAYSSVADVTVAVVSF